MKKTKSFKEGDFVRIVEGTHHDGMPASRMGHIVIEYKTIVHYTNKKPQPTGIWTIFMTEKLWKCFKILGIQKCSMEKKRPCVKSAAILLLIGDLVQCVTEPLRWVSVLWSNRRWVLAGMIVSWGMPHEPPCIKVQWAAPSFYDPRDGSSVMYEDEVMVISERR